MDAFWKLVVDVWKDGLWGIDLGRILVAVVIFLGFLLLRRLFARLVVGRLRAVARRTRTRMDDEALEVLEKPMGLIPVVLGLFTATQYLQLSGTLADVTDRLVRSLIVVVIFWSLIKLVKPFSVLLRKLESVLTVPIVEWLIKAVGIVLAAVGAATVLEIWGIRIGPIIAGLGLFGVAVALGAQDLFKNLISGILILVERRYNLGDWIKVEGVVEGTVETIGFRSTTVRRFDQAPVIVPNAKLSDNSVINFSGMTHRRIYWTIGVEYRTTIDQLRRIRDGIEAYVLGSEDFVDPSKLSTFIRIDRFSDSSIDILVYCFTQTTNWGRWLEIKEQLAYHIKQLVESVGSGFAFPSQSVYLESVPAERPEIFVPPADPAPGEAED